MSLVKQLTSDLTILSTDSKRKYAAIRAASDKSLSILKSFPIHSSIDQEGVVTSIQTHPEFIDPFILSCQSKNSKLITVSLSALSRLVLSHALPYVKLDEVISALQDATHSSTDIQLKILQILPSLFEIYAMEINDKSLSNLLYVCTLLQNSTKTPSIINTAQATFSQLMNTVFEKVSRESVQIREDDIDSSPRYTVAIDDDKTVKVYLCAYDARRVFNDLCTLIEHHKPSFLKTNYMTEDDGFEMLESIIQNNQQVLLSHVELAYLLRVRVAPILLRFISSCNDFTLMVRVSRVAYLMISKVLDITKIESEVTLSLLTHLISKESQTPVWKKIFCLEIYSSLTKDFRLAEKMFNEYDNNKEEERRTVLSDFLVACLEIMNDSRSKLNTGDIVQPPPSQRNGHNQNDNSSGAQYTSLSITQGSALSTPSTVSQLTNQDPTIFSLQKSTAKQKYMDSIDKPDPPEVSSTYDISLICQSITHICDGIYRRSIEIAKSHNALHSYSSDSGIPFLSDELLKGESSKDIHAAYASIYSFTENNWMTLQSTIEIILHSTLDDETFSQMARSLQKLCRASGILSVENAKDSILKVFAGLTINLTGKLGYQNKVVSFGESIAGTISSAIGQAVSNMSHNSSRPSTDTVNRHSIGSIEKMYSRNINSRQTICFRALINLSISLGEILEDSWNTVMITLQWVSYYIDGPSGFSVKDVPPISPFLDNNDLSLISASLEKFMTGLDGQPPDVFMNICKSLIHLSDSILYVSAESDNQFGRMPVCADGVMMPCIYNKQFYMNRLSDICEVNPLKFLIKRTDCWKLVNSFYTRLSCDRSIDDETRPLLSRNFDTIVKAVAVAGFGDESADTEDELKKVRSVTEMEVLTALNSYLTKISNLPIPSELLVMNQEIQMVLQVLNTLKIIIDRFGNKIRDEWVVVTSMLNFPFEIINRANSDMIQESTTKAMIISLLRSSFETLKVILDEILQSIPSKQIQAIIDTLYNFVCQQYELNISFNASSYFWLISDYLKEKLDSHQPDESRSSTLIESSISSEEKLVEAVTTGFSEIESNHLDYYRCLWLYLLLKLGNTTGDQRAQVRNGSIITFFNVVDSYADENPSWLLIYKIVLEPVILQILPATSVHVSSRTVQKEWIKTLTDVANGLTKLFTQYLCQFSDKEDELSHQIMFWNGYTDYMSKLAGLDPSWISLNTRIFENFNSVLDVFESGNLRSSVPVDVVEGLYNFWVNVKIVYSLTDDTFYEDSLCSFASAFPALFRLVQSVQTIPKFERMLMQLNTCIRFPVLIASRKDDERCNKIQCVVLDDLEPMSFSDYRYNSLLIQQLASIVTLPFSTKDLIESKLGAKGVRIPSFKAASYRAIGLLKKRLDDITDPLPYLNDRSILKIFDLLLEPCQLKSDERIAIKNGYIWMESVEILCNLSYKVCDYVIFSGARSDIKEDVERKIWPKILEVFKTCFIAAGQHQSSEEDFDCKVYNGLKEKLVTLIRSESNSAHGLDADAFIKTICESSFLYQLNEVDCEILLISGSSKNIPKSITTNRVNRPFGSTLPTRPVSRLKIAKLCLKDLIALSVPGDGNLYSVSFDYFTARCAFSLDKYLSDQQLLNGKPVPRVQQTEIKILLEGLLQVLEASDKYSIESSQFVHSRLSILYPVLVGMIGASSKVIGLQDRLVSVFRELGKYETAK
ncbi:hypothetical protein FOA43_000733 [Brettanomyces nanus]|uniref:Protein MON2 homolog n=1 Tax=Eeniella nana TaxID=13502 RepID=A0A875RXY3_EENNA|nr:uncharacterized protein FOA43_000733 [Brettanomyces nanus]QPG73423.1 hypothetical protein FOA43_000733 [Brettanomyces nanus]